MRRPKPTPIAGFFFKGGKKEEAPDLVHIGASQKGGSAA